MTIYVAHVGPIIVGPSKNSDTVSPFLKSIPEVKVETLPDFLANLKPEEKTFLSNGIVTQEALVWGGKVFSRNALRGQEVQRIITPMIKEGKIPTDLDFVYIQEKLGIPTRELFELSIIELLKDVGEEGIRWSDDR